VTVSVPWSVPADRVSVDGLIASPLEKFAVPEEMTSELPIPDTVPAGSKLTVPR